LDIPAQVRDYVRNLPHPSGLIGCRAVQDRWSLDCCEYDIAVFGQGDNCVVQAGGHVVELVHFGSVNYPVELAGMAVLNDAGGFALSSAAKALAEKRPRALAAYGRKSLVTSLFCQQRMKENAGQPVIAAMWSKMSSYHFIRGTLALSGSRPMPLHELAQVRQLDLRAGAAEGAEAALESIGIERATRPAIARSTEAVVELKSGDYDRELLRSKIVHLLEKSMLADCYYYLGRVACESLAGRNGSFHSRYAKLVQISLDLTSDVQSLERLQKSLFRAAKKGLAA
jgi:hypothetical protein